MRTKKTGPNGPVGGNTKAPTGNRVKNWCFTWNNYTEANVVRMLEFLENMTTMYQFQEETGSNGTPHLQGVFTLKDKARWSEFNLPSKIHWEQTISTEASVNYCSKEDTRTGRSWSKNLPRLPDPIEVREPSKQWELDVLEIMNTKPDYRKIYWFWDDKGNFGKSSFCKYLVVKLKVLPVIGGRLCDIVNLLINQPIVPKTIVFDIPRGHGGHVSYDALECIKNGLVVNTKFEGSYKVFNTPHVFIFSNEPPANPEKLSEDRWIIKQLNL